MEEVGGAFVHPFNDPFVIAGQGTVGLEIAEDAAALGIVPDVVLVPCSGGGLGRRRGAGADGEISAGRGLRRRAEGFRRLRAGRCKAGTPQRNAKLAGSISDALLAPSPGAISFEMNRARLAGGLVASDPETLVAVGFAFDELRLVVEPGGAVGLAALLAGRLEVKGRTVVIVLSGGNVGDDILAEGIRAYRASESSAPSPDARRGRLTRLR